MNENQILLQSKAAYNQWKEQWREHATWHSKEQMRPLVDFENIGIGKAVLCIANGFSFEENLDTIKKYQDNVDIMVCDKTLGHCLDNGIRPTYVLVCDANVSYEKYLEPWKDRVGDIILFSNVCANPQWSEGINWKSKYFFVNKDILKSEVEFSKLSGCQNQIPAATNVSNAMVVFLTQSDNSGRNNFFGYDKILVIGYDYSWRAGKKYYSFDEIGGGKTNYMRHVFCKTHSGETAYTSGNLAFSAEWLDKYIKTFDLTVVQCSAGSILNPSTDKRKRLGDLEHNMKYKFRQGDQKKVVSMVAKLNSLRQESRKIDSELRKMGQEHFIAAAQSI